MISAEIIIKKREKGRENENVSYFDVVLDNCSCERNLNLVLNKPQLPFFDSSRCAVECGHLFVYILLQ